MVRIINFCLIISLNLVSLSMASEIDGIWKGKIEGPEGEKELIFTLKVNGDTLTGTVDGLMGKQPIQNGKIDGLKFSFDTEVNGNLISHQCSVSDSTLKVSVEQFQADIELKRIPPIDIDGRWLGKMQGPDGGEMEMAFVFKVDGEKLTGTVEGPMGDMTITNGRLNGTEFSFDVDPGGMMIGHQCKALGDSISMKVIGMPGGMEVILKRPAIKE